LIKANITSRITFQVASQVDSRTILDMAGAEKLLGAGDMLFTSSSVGKPKRIQGAFISEKEVNKVVDYIKSLSQENMEYARLIDILEERKVIGPGDGAKPREVYIKDDEESKLDNDGFVKV